MIELLRKTDRTLLEMHTGMILFGAICQLVGAFLVKDQSGYAKSLWFGVLLAVAGSIHMARTLDRALVDGVNATKVLTVGYVIRYIVVAAFFIALSLTEIMNPLFAFLGYMSLKVTAYLQPLTHKFYNMLFHETDPIPEPMAIEEGEDEVKVSGEKDGFSR